MATNEFFFPDTETVRIYIDMIHNQGMEVCRNRIDKEWLDGSLSKFSFGIAIYTNKAQIGQSRKKKTDKYLKGFILCRIDNDSPYTVWIDLVCLTVMRSSAPKAQSRETSRVGTKLMQQAEEYTRSNKEIRVMMLYTLPEEPLKQWYRRHGFGVSNVDIWDGKTKAFLMTKFL